MKKPLLISLALLVIGSLLFVYFSFSGLPWKKISVGKELRSYVEDKYDIQVTKIDNHYNFKYGSYESTFQVNNKSTFEFQAEKLSNGEFTDNYVEEYWVNQAEKELSPLIEKSFPSLSKKDYSVGAVYGVASDLGITDVIPNYKDVNSALDLRIDFDEYPTKENKEALTKETLLFLSDLRKLGADRVGLILSLEKGAEDQADRQAFFYSFDHEEVTSIKTEKDLLPYGSEY